MAKDKLTENDRRLASAWIDQELPESDREYIESRLVEGDAELKREIAEFRFSRAEFRKWFETEIAESSRNVDVWAQIQRELRKPAPASLLERVREAIRENFRIATLAVAGLAAVMLMLIATDEHRGANLNLAQRDALEIERVSENRPVNDELPLVLAGTNSSTRPFNRTAQDLPLPLPVPDALAVKLLSSPQLIVGNDVQGGFRAGETDIEWIKSDRPFKLVSPKRLQTPPVIWVANRKH